MNNQDLIEKNELNKESNGGTEITTRELFDQLDREELEGVQVVTSRVRDLDENKTKIFFAHDLAGDPEAQFLMNDEGRSKFDKLVFVSNWQYQQYRDYLGVPYNVHSTVIENGIHPLEFKEKPKDKIRLIYTSTPHRGLEILVPVFEELAKTHPEIELDVYSSFGIYGSSWESRDQVYADLFQRCKDHPQINYHGWVEQAEIRSAYERAHIFAFPSIWPETSCRCLIESMSAGLLCVHPNFAALPDTSAGLTIQYQGDIENHQNHANIFYAGLEHAINRIKTADVTNYTQFVKAYADTRFSWDTIVPRWKSLLAELKHLKNESKG